MGSVLFDKKVWVDCPIPNSDKTERGEVVNVSGDLRMIRIKGEEVVRQVKNGRLTVPPRR